MDQKGNTKSGPGQSQSPEPQESDKPKAGPVSIAPRKCQICGGPNHHGCGCEAKARKENTRLEVPTKEDEQKWEQDFKKQSGYKIPETPAADDNLEDILTGPAIRKHYEANLKTAEQTEKIANGIEDLRVCFYDMNNYLKVIAGDVITIRNYILKEKAIRDSQLKEDEVKNAAENRD